MTSPSSSPFTCIQWNARGLTKSRLEELRHHLCVYNPMIVLLSETHWNRKVNPRFQSYAIVRLDRLGMSFGGVAILIHKTICFTQISVLSCNNLEAIGSSVPVHDGAINFISTYCPRGFCTVEEFEVLVDSTGFSFVMGGDFNGHHELWEWQ